MKEVVLTAFLLLVVDATTRGKDWREIVIAGMVGIVAIALYCIDAYQFSFEEAQRVHQQKQDVTLGE